MGKTRLAVVAIAGLFAASAAISSSGCRARAPVINVTGVNVYAHVWERTLDRLAPQAAYELQCPEEQLAFGLVKKRRRKPTQIAVEGCGHSVLYAWTRVNRRKGWHLVAVEVSGDPHMAPPPRYQPPHGHYDGPMQPQPLPPAVSVQPGY